ncbi:MAG: hypothetical protein WEC84_00905 [Candidatus Andersenbacteria bacterium]
MASSISVCYPIRSSHKSLQDALAAGKYDYIHDYITAEHFKLEGEIVIDAKAVLYHPNRDIGSKDVVWELGQAGLRPATLQELCTFGEKYPYIVCGFPVSSVVALGSVYVRSRRHRYVPSLVGWDWEDDSWYEFDLDHWSSGWNSDDSFLAVPVEKSAD